MKTDELIGPALDWAVSQCYGVAWEQGDLDAREYGPGFRPSTEWDHGGSIIEREGLTLIHQGARWAAQTDDDLYAYGPTPLVAAMRCYCCAKLGDEVEIPKELQ
jgi:hypothetical protein